MTDPVNLPETPAIAPVLPSTKKHQKLAFS